ncbi:MAG: hydrogenase maturation nickel metallochaperone HypA [Chloroflexi bacterium]|nr:hydrogenase maturation nickel metallochaperone HypA [Chloroflexota bacterium]
MHSLGLAQNILQAALIEAEKHQARHIRAINMKLDKGFSECDSLQFCLRLFSRGTIADGARIDIELVDIKQQDKDCSYCAVNKNLSPLPERHNCDHLDAHQTGELLSVILEID